MFHTGVSFAFQNGLKYNYEYNGRIALGIPELRDQVSGTGIKMQVEISLDQSEKALVQVMFFQVYNSHFCCTDYVFSILG